MSTGIRDHLRSNVVGYIALFFVLTGGTAYALDGSNTVFSDDIVNGQVQNPDLGAGSVTSGKILDGNVNSADLSTNSVSSGKIVDGNVRTPDYQSGSITNDKLGADAVTSGKILDGQVQNQDLGPDAVTSDKILDGSVGNADLANGSVGTGNFGTIPAARIGAGAGAVALNGCSFSAAPNDSTFTVAFLTNVSDSENFDTDNLVHTQCNGQFDDGLSAPVDGVYLVGARLAWDANSGHDRKIQIHVVGSSTRDYGIVEGPPVGDAGKWTQQSTSAVVDLKAGDLVQLQAYQNSGGSLSMQAGDLTMAWLGPA